MNSLKIFKFNILLSDYILDLLATLKYPNKISYFFFSRDSLGNEIWTKNEVVLAPFWLFFREL